MRGNCFENQDFYIILKLLFSFHEKIKENDSPLLTWTGRIGRGKQRLSGTPPQDRCSPYGQTLPTA